MTKFAASPERQFVVSQLSSTHNRSEFSSGNTALDHYLQKQASQDMRRRVSTCFVATCTDNRIAGYYTLASSGLPLPDLPHVLQKKLPRYPLVPAVRMGRLAVHQPYQGKKLGSALLADALERTIRADIACFALVVDAKNEAASAFYKQHGFITLSGQPLCLFLPLAQIARHLDKL